MVDRKAYILVVTNGYLVVYLVGNEVMKSTFQAVESADEQDFIFFIFSPDTTLRELRDSLSNVGTTEVMRILPTDCNVEVKSGGVSDNR